MCPHPLPPRAEVRVRGGRVAVYGATSRAAEASAGGDAAGTAPSAPVAVLAHGLCLDRTEWAAVEEGLTMRGIECFSYDHLGQGDSDTPEARGFSLSIDALADDMADVCEAAGGGAPVHLVGHSMGGYCALRVASRRPELVASLTLVGSRAQAEHPFKLVEIALMSLVVVIFGTPPIVTKLMAMMFGPAFVRKQPAAARDIQAHLAALPRRTLRAVWGVIMRGAVSDADLRAIQCPVLIVHGELDASVPIEHARETAARLPSLRRVATLPGVGHTPAVEAPAETTSLIAEFIDESICEAPPAAGSI